VLSVEPVAMAYTWPMSAAVAAEPIPLSTDIYAVITYYLRHRSEVESYLERRREDSFHSILRSLRRVR